MDYYTFGPTRHHTPSKDPEIPFFEDAFDTETLKKFFKYQGSTPLISTKYLQNTFMEEENPSHPVELISPATTNISSSLLDILHEEVSHDFLSQSQSGLTNSLGNLLNPGMNQSHSETINDFSYRDNRVSGSMTTQANQNGDPQDMIAMICQQLQQQYYTGDSTPNMGTMGANVEGNQGVQGVNKTRMMSWQQEDAMEPTVLRKLISKKSVFTIQKEVKVQELGLQRKMSTQVEVNKLKAKRKASAPLFMERLNSDVSDVGFQGLIGEEKQLKVARKNSKKEKEKEEKTTSRKNSIFGSQLNVKVSDVVEKKQDKASKTKKMVIGNVTVGVKDVANPQVKFSS